MSIYLQAIASPEGKRKFEIIYRMYYKLMFCMANAILKNQYDAEDAVHQAFLAVAEHLEKIGEPNSRQTRNYLLVIVENKAIDILRKNTFFDYVALDETVLCKAEGYCEDDTLSRCILRLPNKYRQVIILKYYQGYSTKEIAEILGISETNAIKLDQRAKKKLSQFCKEEELL